MGNPNIVHGFHYSNATTISVKEYYTTQSSKFTIEISKWILSLNSNEIAFTFIRCLIKIYCIYLQ